MINKVLVEKEQKKLELNPIRDQTLDFVNNVLFQSLDKKSAHPLKKIVKQYIHSIFMQCTDKENIEYLTSLDFEEGVVEEVTEEVDESLIQENEALKKELQALRIDYENKRNSFLKQEAMKLQTQVLDAKSLSLKKNQENMITFIDSKKDNKETKTYNKQKLFKSFLQHHNEKLSVCEESIKESLEDLERNLNNFKEDFKKVLEKQQDLLLISNNDGINNLLVDFKEIYK